MNNHFSFTLSLIFLCFSVQNITCDPTKNLFIAIASDNIIKAQRALDEGADINATDVKGNTPLAIAILGENLELVGFLLGNGANNIPNNDGITPFELAADRGIYIIQLNSTRPPSRNPDLKFKKCTLPCIRHR